MGDRKSGQIVGIDTAATSKRFSVLTKLPQNLWYLSLVSADIHLDSSGIFAYLLTVAESPAGERSSQTHFGVGAVAGSVTVVGPASSWSID